jgi:cyclopropane-fatty-acyl-phospholipid synthase
VTGAGVLEAFLRGVIRTGRLTVRTDAHRTMSFGEASPNSDAPNVAIHLRGPLTALKLGIHPELCLGEAYMSGALVVEQGELWDLMELIGLNLAHQNGPNLLGRSLDAMRRHLAGVTGPVSARRNAAHHYDLSLGGLYQHFLDPDLQYSCAYFPDPEMSLKDAQAAKKRHIIAKLFLEPGQGSWTSVAAGEASRWNLPGIGASKSSASPFPRSSSRSAARGRETPVFRGG